MMAAEFCPLLKASCKENECLMFRGQACLLISFLSGSQERISALEKIEPEEINVPQWLEVDTTEQIKTRIFEFMNTEYPDDEDFDPYLICELFWDANEIEKFAHSTPIAITAKMESAERLFRKEFVKMRKNKKDQYRKASENGISSKETSVPNWLLKIKPSEVSGKIIEFLRIKIPNYETVPLNQLADIFWKSNGIERFRMPPEIQKTMMIAESLVAIELLKNRNGTEKSSKIVKSVDLLDAAEVLADQMLAFIKKEHPELATTEDMLAELYALSQLFFESRGLKSGNESQELQLRINQTNFLVRNRLKKEIKKERKQQLENEKAQLPSIICEIMEWVKQKRLKKITQHELHAFLSEKKISLLEETKRELYSRANVELKYKRNADS